MAATKKGRLYPRNVELALCSVWRAAAMPGPMAARSAWELADEEGRAVTTEEVVDGVAAVLEHFIAQTESAHPPSPPTVFDGPPPIADVSAHGLLSLIVNSGLCSKECFIMSLVYVERILQQHPGFRITRRNFHRFIVASVLVGSKVLDDFYCRNVYYAVATGLTKAELNGLELSICDLLDFNLHVQPAEFALYRDSLIRKTGGDPSVAAKPTAVVPFAMATAPEPDLPAPMMPMPSTGSPTARSWTDVVKAKTPERATHDLLHHPGLPAPAAPALAPVAAPAAPAPVQQLFAPSAFETPWKETVPAQPAPTIHAAEHRPRASAAALVYEQQHRQLQQQHRLQAMATAYQRQVAAAYQQRHYPTPTAEDPLGASNAWFGTGAAHPLAAPVRHRPVQVPLQHFAANRAYDRQLPAALQAM